ncbi:MAG: hypothetical protein IT245_02325 [Bacteroidia bacterium]|nr:hypothetical protein [Bacteroidia bacterium]
MNTNPNNTIIKHEMLEKLFSGRPLLIATKHSKERVIGPIMDHYLGVQSIKCTQFDTDKFGTFTGEVLRYGDALQTAREKCRSAMELLGYDLCIASEGSFGQHPNIPFLATNEEILILIDTKNNLEISICHSDCETNYKQSEINSYNELMQFALEIGFNDHGIIFRKDSYCKKSITKDCLDWRDLKSLYKEYQEKYNSFTVETDMRAMRNPTRMRVIEKAAKKLAKKIIKLCPDCNTPGYSVQNITKGLPCFTCGFPTNTPRNQIYTCLKCAYSETEEINIQKKFENPLYCNICNP